MPVYPHRPRLWLSIFGVPSTRCWASRSARPGSPSSRTRSATSACGRRWIVSATPGVRHRTKVAQPWRRRTRRRRTRRTTRASRLTSWPLFAARSSVRSERRRKAPLSTRERTREIVDEIAAAASRVRSTIEDFHILDEVKRLRRQGRDARRAGCVARSPAEYPSRGTPAEKPAAVKKPAARKAAARKKPAARKAAAKKPAAAAREAGCGGQEAGCGGEEARGREEACGGQEAAAASERRSRRRW